MDLDSRLARLEGALTQLVEAQARTEARLEQLVEAQARTEARLEQQATQIAQLTQSVQSLAEAQARTEARLEQQATQITQLSHDVQALVSWQRGEAGRRDGERYERDVVRRAPVLFNGGSGGPPEQPEVQRRLTTLLRHLLAKGLVPPAADPFLADLLWWKGERLAVVEVALQVNGDDVVRAVQRAETLRQGGAQAFALVIGERWATLDTRERARTLGAEWKVGDDLSDGYLAFRRLPAEAETGAA